ncbi:MAG: MMPL family transporter [Actinomycetota bacterium]|nr:MMPL family transporter [Actinomycetota bacterium]
MEQELRSFADFVARHRVAVVAIWLALIAGGGYFALHQHDRLTGGGWNVAGSDPSRAETLLKRFHGFSAPGLGVVVTGATPSAVTKRLAAIRPRILRHRDLHPGPVQLLPDGRAGLLPLTYTTGFDDAMVLADDLVSELSQSSAETKTRVIGDPAIWAAYREVSKRQAEHGELLGFPIIFLILLASFGTLVAVVAPLTLGFIAVFMTAALVYWLSRVYTMSVFVTNMASMIGIGVSVDYSLFVVSRFRAELAAGRSKEEALRTALSTAGSAVVFSGLTVAVALVGLMLVDLNGLRSMALGAIIVVLVAVLGSITLLPALLALVGRNVGRFGVPVPWNTEGEGGGAFWSRWATAMLRRPIAAVVVGGAVMLLLAVPALSMKTYFRGLLLLPKDEPVREATEQIQRAAGPGSIGPVNVLVSGDVATAQRIRTAATSIPGVARVGALLPSDDGSVFLTSAILSSDPESGGARATLKRMETRLRPLARQASADVRFGGVTARETAVNDEVLSSLWKVVLFVIAVTFLVLTFLLRSLVLPVKAVLMNCLSVGAAFGILVAVFQWGWLDWTGYGSPGYVDVLVIPLVLAITFGLSMDYEVFLLARIRERQLTLGDTNRGVAEGVAASARIITSAALIMVAVFLAFGIAGSIQLKELGVGLAAAIALDATLVRLVLVPATMALLSERNWWLPGWLARILPSTGEIVQAETKAATKR